MRKLFTFILALVAGAGTLFAEGGSCGQDGSTVKWDLTDGVLKITGTGEMADYSESNHAPWYSKRSKIESVQIMSAVTHIGSYAFLDCTNMTALTIGTGSKRTLGEGAFKNCTKLEEVVIPATVSDISKYAFQGCTGLTSVHLPEGLYSIENRAFAGCTSLASITIPRTVKSINLYAFSQTIALKTVYFNAQACNDFTGTTSVGSDHVFPALNSLTFGDAVEYVPAKICMYSEYLKSVTFGKNIRKIGEKAFDHCNKLEAPIILPDKLDTISEFAFAYSKITSVTFGKNIKYIGQQAFYGCTGLTSLVLTGNVYVFDHAFAESSNLKSVTIGEDVDYLHYQAFEHCPVQSVVWNVKNYTRSVSGTASPFKHTSNFVTSFVFGENVERIPAELCSGLRIESITIPESVTSIGKDAFKSCSSLNSVVWNARACGENTYSDSAPFYAIRQQITSLVIGDKVTFIPSYLCYEMNKLTDVVIPASVISIGNHAFDGCSKWAGQNIVIPNDVMTLGDYAFANCNLATITIGSKVNSIGKYAFMGNDNMTAVYNESETPQSITANVFGDLNLSACDLYVPEASISAYKAANVWKNFRSFNPTCLQGSGTTGNLKWTLSCSGKLSITGTGAIPHYSTYQGEYYQLCTAPWFGESKPNHTVKTAEISDGITSVGAYTFWQCQDMTDVYIPNTVTMIGDYAFYYNKALKAVTLSDNIESIGQQAFTQCTSLTSLTLPIHLKSIESTAFALCSGLTSVVIPDEVEAIHDEAFAHCINLTELTIPASVTTIDVRAFTYCTKLTAVWNKATTPQKIESNVFGALDKSKCKLYVPKNAVAAYMNAPVWKEFDIQTDEGILASGICGVEGDNLTWTLTTDGLLTISGTGGMGWTGATAPWDTWKNAILSVVIEDGATDIRSYAFSECGALSHIEIPNTVTLIRDGAFFACHSLSEIAIPNGVTDIGNYTFLQCFSLTSIVIPEGVTSIGSMTFGECGSLAKVTIPSTVTSIGAGAFKSCSSLTSIVLPAALTTINASAFMDCVGLETVTNKALTPQVIEANVFSGVTLSEVCLYVPESVIDAYKAAAVWKEFNPIWPIGYVPTAVESVQPSAASLQKVLRNGVLYIEKDGKTYTVTGQRMQ